MLCSRWVSVRVKALRLSDKIFLGDVLRLKAIVNYFIRKNDSELEFGASIYMAITVSYKFHMFNITP